MLSHGLFALHWLLLAKLLPAQAQAGGRLIGHVVHVYSCNTTRLGQSLKTRAQSGAVLAKTVSLGCRMHKDCRPPLGNHLSAVGYKPCETKVQPVLGSRL